MTQGLEGLQSRLIEEETERANTNDQSKKDHRAALDKQEQQLSDLKASVDNLNEWHEQVKDKFMSSSFNDVKSARSSSADQ